MNRSGLPVSHDFQAAFSQVGEGKDILQDTPQDTRTVFELDFELADNCPSSSGPVGDDGYQDGPSGQDQSQNQAQDSEEHFRFTPERRKSWAGFLGVSDDFVGEPFWTWFEGVVDETNAYTYKACDCRCGCSCEADCPHGD